MGNIKEFIKPVCCLLNSVVNFDVFFMDPDLWLDMYQFSVRCLVNLSPLLLQTEPEAGASRLLSEMPENFSHWSHEICPHLLFFFFYLHIFLSLSFGLTVT